MQNNRIIFATSLLAFAHLTSGLGLVSEPMDEPASPQALAQSFAELEQANGKKKANAG